MPNVTLINIRPRVSHAADARNQWRKCTNASGSTFPLESGLNDVAVQRRGARGRQIEPWGWSSNLWSLYRSLTLFLSRSPSICLFLAVSPLHLSFSLVPLVSIAFRHSRRTCYPSKPRAGCCWWDEHQVATSHSPFIPVTRSRSRERRRTTNYNLHKHRTGVSIRYLYGQDPCLNLYRQIRDAPSLILLKSSSSF